MDHTYLSHLLDEAMGLWRVIPPLGYSTVNAIVPAKSVEMAIAVAGAVTGMLLAAMETLQASQLYQEEADKFCALVREIYKSDD